MGRWHGVKCLIGDVRIERVTRFHRRVASGQENVCLAIISGNFKSAKSKDVRRSNGFLADPFILWAQPKQS